MRGMLHDTRAMIDDLNKASAFMRVWGPALNMPQILGGLVFITRIEAAAVLIACVATVMAAAQIHKRLPFSRLTSIVHIVWLPLLPILIESLMREGGTTAYGLWLAYVIATMAISLLLDGWNLVLYAFTRSKRFEGAARREGDPSLKARVP